MTNINCSASCAHENNGKCTLNHVSISSSYSGIEADCAYFEPKQQNSGYKDKSIQL